MSGYTSIREDVLKKLQHHLPEIQQQFGIETLGIFGSVARGEDGPESDIDILYTFRSGIKTYHALLDLADYLEALLGRHVDLISAEWLSPHLRPYVESDLILYGTSQGTA